jgi:hypothetical protein
MSRRDEELTISGGKFVRPDILPPTREAQIQVDWANAYHFGNRPNYKISAEGGIRALVPGSGSYITNLRVRSGGVYVNQLPAGAQFDIVCDFYAENASGGIINAWSCCVTVKDTLGSAVKNYRIQQSTTSLPDHIGDENFLVNGLGSNIMPASNINLRFWLWGIDDYTPVGPPADNLW